MFYSSFYCLLRKFLATSPDLVEQEENVKYSTLYYFRSIVLYINPEPVKKLLRNKHFDRSTKAEGFSASLTKIQVLPRVQREITRLKSLYSEENSNMHQQWLFFHIKQEILSTFHTYGPSKLIKGQNKYKPSEHTTVEITCRGFEINVSWALKCVPISLFYKCAVILITINTTWFHVLDMPKYFVAYSKYTIRLCCMSYKFTCVVIN